jgi:uncharacterized membrane protein YbhN (UPF0104 family)
MNTLRKHCPIDAHNPGKQASAGPAAHAAWRTVLSVGLFIVIAALSVWQLHQQFGPVSGHELAHALRSASLWQASTACALTALSFVCMASYDVMAAQQVAPARVPRSASFMAGACANAVSNTLGFHALTGSVVRARLYARWGLSLADVAKLASLSWLALGLGFLAMLALALATQGLHSGAVLIAIALSVFVVWLWRRPRQLRLFGFVLPLPTGGQALLQMGVGAVESAAAIGALYVLLPPDLAPSLALFAVGYISAVALGLLANSPGGLGVFEAGITALVAGHGRADLLAALLLYRLVYNILPFMLALLAMLALALTSARAGRLHTRRLQLDGG